MSYAPKLKNMKRMRRTKGFTLVEVMVAVFVFAVGLLGLAGLQLASLKNNQSAYLRSQAVQFAYDISDRMRANPVGILNGGSLIGGGFDDAVPAQDTNCYFDPVTDSAAGCTPAAMAGNDLFELMDSAAGSELPGSSSVICIDSTPVDGIPGTEACDGTGNVFAIKVWWVDDRSNTPKRFVTTVGF